MKRLLWNLAGFVPALAFVTTITMLSFSRAEAQDAASVGAAAAAAEAHAVDAAAPVPATPATEDESPPPDASSILKGVEKVATDYKAGGMLAAVAALLALLMQVTKVPMLRKLLDDRGLAWLRPVGILVITAAAGLVGALQQGVKPGPALLMAALSGVTGVGLREIMKNLSANERNRVQVDVNAVSTASEALRSKLESDAEAKSDQHLAETKMKIAALDKLPERQRLEKLASLLSEPAKPVIVQSRA